MISIIAAIGKNRELGKDNKLLWSIPQDLIRFKKLTLNHPVIMGRTTYQSIGRPLPNRTNIVVTRDFDFLRDKIIVCHSIDEAIKTASQKDEKEIFIIGGGQIYAQSINLADTLYLTVVDSQFDADTYFPDYSHFSEVISKKEESDSIFRYTFLELKKPFAS